MKRWTHEKKVHPWGQHIRNQLFIFLVCVHNLFLLGFALGWPPNKKWGLSYQVIRLWRNHPACRVEGAIINYSPWPWERCSVKTTNNPESRFEIYLRITQDTPIQSYPLATKLNFNAQDMSLEPSNTLIPPTWVTGSRNQARYSDFLHYQYINNDTLF